MKPIQTLIITAGIFLFISCKKEAKVETPVAVFGTLMGDGSNVDISKAIQLDDHSIIVCGKMRSDNYQDADAFLLKVDEHFNLLWLKKFGGTRIDIFNDMDIDENGNILLAGTSYSFSVSIDSNYIWPTKLFYIVFTDKNGNLLWEKKYQPKNTGNTVNKDNLVSKVLYLKNNQFCVAGATGNFNQTFNPHSYSFGIDTKGAIQWEKLFYNPADNSSEILNAALCEDGDVMLLNSRFYDFNSSFRPINLLKTSIVPGPFSENDFTMKGPEINNTLNWFDNSLSISMEMISENKMVIEDKGNGRLLFTNNTGGIQNTAKLSSGLTDINFYRRNNQLFITAIRENRPFWAITDLSGEMINQSYVDLNLSSNQSIIYQGIFLNDQDQITAVGKLTDNGKEYIIFLKYDKNGNIIIQ